MNKLFFSIAAAGMLSSAITYAGDAAGNAGQWRISGGAAIRTIKADQHINAPAALPTSRNLSGKGDVGLFTINDSQIIYDDGILGPIYNYYGTIDGTCYGTINNRSQLVETDRPYSGSANFYQLSFHTTRSEDITTYKATPYDGDDEESVIAPFVQARRNLGNFGRVQYGVLAGYSLVKSELSSGTRLLATENVDRQTKTYTYKYDHVASASGASSPNAQFPYTDYYSWTVYDPAVLDQYSWAGVTTAFAPRQSDSTSYRRRTSYEATGCVESDVMLHEIMLAPECVMDVMNRGRVGLAIGPTINIVDVSTDASRKWTQVGGDTLVSETASDDSTEVKVGIGVDVSAQIDITKRIFGQVGIGYRYVPSIDIDAGFASSEIDASSFQGSVGVGVIL